MFEARPPSGPEKEQIPESDAAAGQHPDPRPWFGGRGLRWAGACLALVSGLVVFAWVADQHYPLGEWLLFMYLRYWLYAALFAAASLSVGLALAKLVVRKPWQVGDYLTLAFALGVLAFALGIFLGGLAMLYGRGFFFAWPGLLLALTGRRAWRDLHRLRRSLGRGIVARLLPHGWVECAAALFLAASLVAVYLLVMTPLNVGGDSYWYHLPIAEHYVASGGIRPFTEGWYLGTYPHLASLLYTWAFQSPGDLFDHVALSSHIEWALFLATLAGVSVLARQLLGGIRVPYAAAAVFLFPGIFLYDSSLITGADHILAFWAPALGIALIRMGERFTVREAALAGALVGATILTKYQGSYFFVPAVLLTLVLAIRAKRIRPVIAWGIACLAISSAHWLKNWIFYGDPFYPLLNKIFADHPFHEGAADLMYWDAQFLLTGTFWQKVTKTLAALVNFSFVPHDWSGFHGDRPVFGSLFTLLIPVLPFLAGRKRRLWLTIIGIHLGVLVWFVTNHQDRYLQALVPWMAACTAGILCMAWRSGLPVRIAVFLLVGFQVAWGADVYFIRSHAMIGDSPLKPLIDHIAAGQQRRYAERRKLHFGSLQAVGERLPASAKVLIHERHDRLGLGTASISDTLAWQGAVDYKVLDTPKETYELWRQLGATDVLWWPDRGNMSPSELAREAGFARSVDLWGDQPETIGDKRLIKLRSEARDEALAEQPTTIAWLGCGGDPPTGIYSPRGLVQGSPSQTLAQDDLRHEPLNKLAAANAIVLRPSCDYVGQASADIPGQFKQMIQAGDVSLWVRR
jgi:hypothetical protein